MLAAATAILVMRLPGSVMLMAVAPVISLAITGLHRPPSTARWLWAFLGCAATSSLIGVFINPSGLSLVNYATLSLTFTLFAVAVLFSGNAPRVAGLVMTALFWTFGLALLVGLLEMASGFKLQPVLYPEATYLRTAGRFIVAAWFPNYNDFAIVVTMFALMVLIRFMFDPGARGLMQFTRVAAYVVAAGAIGIGGSRGALLGLLAGTALIVVHSVRLARPTLITALAVIVGTLTAVLAAVYVWNSPWVQDHSTSLRGEIMANTLKLTPDNSPQFWFGWGDAARFRDATTGTFPGILMDPHNVVLEVFTWFGLPTLVILIALWAYVCWRALWRLELRRGWAGAAAAILFALTPVLGIVPSSTLRYYHLFLIAPCAIAFLHTPSRTKEGS